MQFVAPGFKINNFKLNDTYRIVKDLLFYGLFGKQSSLNWELFYYTAKNVYTYTLV